jgi:uncharacterized protein DUF5946
MTASIEMIGDKDREPCPCCGARLGGRAGCQRTFDELQAQSSTSPRRAAVHNLAVDAFAMQHTEEYGKSAKSYIFHLTALCCGVEASGDVKSYWGIPRLLDGPTTLARPDDILFRGTMTVADAQACQDDGDYPEVVRRWASEVWSAYAGLHTTARQWLQEVRVHLASARGVRR